jgi:hypothetical protein
MLCQVLGGDRAAAPPPGVCAFTQRAGEVVSLPAEWLHATLNEGSLT